MAEKYDTNPPPAPISPFPTDTNDIINLVKEWNKRVAQLVHYQDIPFLLEVVAVLANRSDDFKRDARDWDITFQFKIGIALSLWLQVKNGKTTAGRGKIENPDITILIPKGRIHIDGSYPYPGELPVDSAEIFSGQVDAESALGVGIIKINGESEDFLKFSLLMECVKQDIKYIPRK